MIKIKRIYEAPSKDDGFRVLVDRLWPRGLSKEKANTGLWLKDIAPSDALRKWFSHDPKKWKEFKEKYFKELKNKTEALGVITKKAKEDTITLLFGVKDEKFNNAAALKEYLMRRVL